MFPMHNELEIEDNPGNVKKLKVCYLLRTYGRKVIFAEKNLYKNGIMIRKL